MFCWYNLSFCLYVSSVDIIIDTHDLFISFQIHSHSLQTRLLSFYPLITLNNIFIYTVCPNVLSYYPPLYLHPYSIFCNDNFPFIHVPDILLYIYSIIYIYIYNNIHIYCTSHKAEYNVAPTVGKYTHMRRKYIYTYLLINMYEILSMDIDKGEDNMKVRWGILYI